MGALAHWFEAAGLATTQISLIRLHSETTRPPRALWVPFELGRPLGLPGDAAFQRRVLEQTLALLDAPSGPVLVDYAGPEPAARADDEAGEGWACPVPLPAPVTGAAAGMEAAVAGEIARLLPWHGASLARRGRTAVGACGLDLAAAAGWLARLCEDPAEPVPPGCALPPGLLAKLVSEDLKAFYLESATARSGPASASELSNWFWAATAAGAMLLELRRRLFDRADVPDELRLTVVRFLVPWERWAESGGVFTPRA